MWHNLRTLPSPEPDLHVPPRAGPSRTRAAERYAFLDALRLVAALQMIVGHSLDALLAEGLRAGPVFARWTFVRGLTSVAFFCAAGLSFVLSARAAGGRRRRLTRAAELLVLGYALRAPLGVLFGEEPGVALARFQAVDVLHCMAAALVTLELVCCVFAGAAARAALAALLAGVCFAAAEPLAGTSACGALAMYWDAGCGAPFPLFPWLAYPLAAFAVGCATFRAPSPRSVVAARLFVAALLALVVSLALWPPTLGVAASRSPAFGALKLALVLALAGVLAAVVARLPALATRLASETLFLYAVHVVVLYAGPLGLAALVGHRLPLPGALAAALGLVTLTALCALSYGRIVPALRRGKPGGTPRPQRRPSPPG